MPDDRPVQQPLTTDDGDGVQEPIAPLHNAACELGELASERHALNKRIDEKKDEILELMREYDLPAYVCRGVHITRGERIKVSVTEGVTAVDDDGDQPKLPTTEAQQVH